MAEKIDERSVQVGAKGATYVTLPRGYVIDVGLEKKSRVEILREGDDLIIRPKRKGEGGDAT